MAEAAASTGEFASGTVAASVTDSPEPPVGSSQQPPAVETPPDIDDILLSSDDGDDDDDWFENDAGYILRAEDNPWKALHMNTITYDHACIQHPKEIDKAFKALLRKYHPDKCRNEMQLQ